VFWAQPETSTETNSKPASELRRCGNLRTSEHGLGGLMATGAWRESRVEA
jgi:hypothetical protein